MEKRLFILLLLSLLLISFADAQAPQKFSYQAIARDKDNNPIVDKAVAVEMRILQNSATGTEVFKEAHTPKTNAFGLFTLEIGSKTALSVNWATGTYFLETKIDPNGGTNFELVGTVQLLAVPYALYAANANEQQKLRIDNNNQLSITKADGTTTLNTVTLPTSTTGGNYTAGSGISITGNSIAATDDSPTNEIQAIALTSNQLSLTRNGGTVDLQPYLDNTDAQRLSIVGTDSLRISGGNTVKIPSLGDQWGGQVVQRDATLQGRGIAADPLSIADGAITSEKIQDGAIRAIDLSRMNAQNGQALRWRDATGWTVETISGGGSSSVAVTSPMTGDGSTGTPLSILDGGITSSKLANDAVTSAKIQNGTIQAADLNSMNATNGQFLKWDDAVNSWIPAMPTVNAVVFTDATLSGDGSSNTNRLGLATNAVTSAKIQNNSIMGVDINDMNALEGQVLKFKKIGRAHV